jgi:hypothetical protein
MSDNTKFNESLGPEVHENWRKWLDCHEGWIVCEYPLFTDAHVTGELADIHGPYKLLNMIPPSLGECLAPTVVLRIAQPQGIGNVPLMKQTDYSRFHGGTIVDEIAALLSLQLGIRLKAGNMNRMFLPGGDPKGCPRAFEMLPDLVTPRYLARPVVPRARGKHSLNQADLFVRLLELAPADAVALVRASRMYQDALWICESQPALAWLFLVCSVETAANHWRKENETPLERLRASKPDAELILKEAGGMDLVEKIAAMFAPYMGATTKFVNFVLEFLPAPPVRRPSIFAQFDWNRTSMRKALEKIYDYRSKALHNGTPFPTPMCDPPVKHDKEFAEKPPGSAHSARGAVWISDDIPMLLSTFEYIAQNSLLNWWESMLDKKETRIGQSHKNKTNE